MAGEQRLLLDYARQVVLVCARGETRLARGGARGLAVLEAASAVVGRCNNVLYIRGVEEEEEDGEMRE